MTVSELIRVLANAEPDAEICVAKAGAKRKGVTNLIGERAAIDVAVSCFGTRLVIVYGNARACGDAGE